MGRGHAAAVQRSGGGRRRGLVVISDADKAKVGSFLSAIVRGAADLGFSSLPLLKTYQQAQKEGVKFSDMLVRDPMAAADLVAAFQRQAKQLPPQVVTALEQVVKAARS